MNSKSEDMDDRPKRKQLSRILPQRLKKNSLIGLVTPSSSIAPKLLDATVKKLEGLGFRVFYKPSVLDEYGYFAGKDEDRANELMSMFSNKEIDAVFCVRGGYGAIRILDYLDYEIIRQNPKALMGYSDITALHTAIYNKTGLVSFHSPMGESDFNDFTVKCFKDILVNPKDHYTYPYLREKKTDSNPEYDLYTIHPGQAEGMLAGGNISVLQSLIGTEYEPDFEGKIAYLEEIEEKTYRVDKMLFHLLSATNLKKATGIVLGTFKNCNFNEKPSISLKEALDDLLKPLKIPVFYGLPFGHIEQKITIPFGAKAKMDASLKTLELLERAVI
jgi:muramoyltetrapeptide carboxypeptidase